MFRLMTATTAFLLMVGATSSAFASDFCEGYRNGYAQGYCYQQFACIKPIPPICPIPNIGERDFQDGYNRGFAEGMVARN